MNSLFFDIDRDQNYNNNVNVNIEYNVSMITNVGKSKENSKVFNEEIVNRIGNIFPEGNLKIVSILATASSSSDYPSGVLLASYPETNKTVDWDWV